MIKAEIKKTDEEIRRDVLRELRWDARVSVTDVGVKVDSGHVTLTGMVSSWGRRLSACEAAHRIAGVLDVANDLRVRVPSSQNLTDSDIGQMVQRVLEWDVFVPQERIESKVEGGVVTLQGMVETWSQREDAARAVRNLRGVVGVINQLAVEPTRILPEVVQREIESALLRQAHRATTHIEVKVHECNLILSGAVHSFAERQAIIGSVGGARGIRQVEDLMSVVLERER